MFKRRRPDGSPIPDGEDDTTTPTQLEGLTVSENTPRPPSAPPAPTRQADSGLGAPPFRPAQPKELPGMVRSPFSTTPNPPPQPVPAPGPAPMGVNQMRPTTAPRPPGRDPAERRTLVVGRGISVQGMVQDAERLVVEGTIEATMIHATELSISAGGVFKGEIEVEDAEIAGTIDGTLTARGNLIVRGTGVVLGTARCRRLQVEDGGQITGRIEMITEPRGRMAVETTV